MNPVRLFKFINITLFEPPHDKTNKMACAPSEDSDQPVHPPSLISVFADRMTKAWFLSYPLSAQRRLWSDWADAQADLSLRWAYRSLCWFCHEAAHFWGVPYTAAHVIGLRRKSCHKKYFEPNHEIMALIALRKLDLQTRMRSNPLGLHVWSGPSSTSIVHVCEQRRLWQYWMRSLAWAFAVRLCNKYHNLINWLFTYNFMLKLTI